MWVQQRALATKALALWVVLAFWIAGTCSAEINIEGQKTGTSPVSHECPEPVTHMCVDRLNPNPITRLAGPSQAFIDAFNTYFPDWSYTANYTKPWTGTLTIDSYKAVDYGVGSEKHDPGCIDIPGLHGMGAELKCHYAPGDNDGIERFRWIQIIITSDPAGGLAPYTPYVDPWGDPPEDNLPFYFKEGEWTDWGLADEKWFLDRPRRECPCLGTVSWQAELYLVDWRTVPGSTTDNYVFVTEGIRWGFEINCVPEPGILPAGLMLMVLVIWIRRPGRSAEISEN